LIYEFQLVDTQVHK